MNDRRIIITAALLGAALGAVSGYLAMTEDGRGARGRLEGWLRLASAEARQLAGLATQLGQVVAEGVQHWQRVSEPYRAIRGSAKEV